MFYHTIIGADFSLSEVFSDMYGLRINVLIVDIFLNILLNKLRNEFWYQFRAKKNSII